MANNIATGSRHKRQMKRSCPEDHSTETLITQ